MFCRRAGSRSVSSASAPAGSAGSSTACACPSRYGVDPDKDPRETWLETVKSRLRSDLARFRADVEGNGDQIEQWSFRDGRIFASIGSPDDEADPLRGHGWMCRLVDAGVLGEAGFERVRKTELEPA